jgi:hypothetical protein
MFTETPAGNRTFMVLYFLLYVLKSLRSRPAPNLNERSVICRYLLPATIERHPGPSYASELMALGGGGNRTNNVRTKFEDNIPRTQFQQRPRADLVFRNRLVPNRSDRQMAPGDTTVGRRPGCVFVEWCPGLSGANLGWKAS